MEIPLRTLRFDATRSPQEWGVNFIRRVRRIERDLVLGAARATVSPAPHVEGRHPDRARQSAAGPQPAGQAVRRRQQLRRGCRCRPATVAHAATSGVDVKYGVTPSLTLDATYNTDFSQVEVDQEQVNLTRFSLLFPERREFFIENSGAFQFGDVVERNYRMGASPSDFTFFNSRQIGLTRGRPADPDCRRRTPHGPRRPVGRRRAQHADAARLTHTPAENFAVLRARRNLFGSSDIGVLLQNRAATDSNTWNRSVGVDANFRLRQQHDRQRLRRAQRCTGCRPGWHGSAHAGGVPRQTLGQLRDVEARLATGSRQASASCGAATSSSSTAPSARIRGPASRAWPK